MGHGIYALENPTKDYAWGSRTAIPRLLGEKTPSDAPIAELWVGAHPDAPSRVAPDNEALDAVIRKDPDGVLGARVARRFGGKMPLLLKLLAAAEPLSIQCHPNKAQAEAGFLREEAAGIPRDAPERSYRDDNHKPELIVAQEPFRALCGFRPRDEIAALFAVLDAPALRPAVRAFSAGGELSDLYRAVMDVPPDARSKIGREAAESVERRLAASAGFILNTANLALPRDEVHTAFDLLLDLARRYPGDPGVLSPLFLNMVTLSPEEGLFLEAGELHSYLEGFGVEIMASSDNVLRGGLTKKHVDVKALLDTLHFKMKKPKILKPVPTEQPGEWVYDTPAPDFRLSVLHLLDGAKFGSLAEDFELLLAIEGPTSRIASRAGGKLDLRPGRSALITPESKGYGIKGGRLYRATVA